MTEDGQSGLRIKCTDVAAEEQIQKMKDVDRFGVLLDGLLQFVYEKLKTAMVK